MNGHKYFEDLKTEAKRKQTLYENARHTNDAIYQGWIISACDQLKSLVPEDVEISEFQMILIDRKVERIGATTSEAGRQGVIKEIVRAISGPAAMAAE